MYRSSWIALRICTCELYHCQHVGAIPQRAFAVSHPTLCNTLLSAMRDPSLTLTQFCALLKTELFREPDIRCQIQSAMSGSSVAAQAGASLPGRWLLPRVRQHSALPAVSRRSDLGGATNIQQLLQQNFCSHWTSFAELSSGPAVQSRHHRWTVQATAEGTSFSEPWTWRALISDMWRLRKTLTYLLIYLMLLTHCSNEKCWHFIALVNVIVVHKQQRSWQHDNCVDTAAWYSNWWTCSWHWTVFLPGKRLELLSVFTLLRILKVSSKNVSK